MLKAIGKYGDRATNQVIPRALVDKVPVSMPYDEFAEHFKKLIDSARGENGAAPLTEMTAEQAGKLLRDTEQAVKNFEAWQFEIIAALQKSAGTDGAEGGMKAVQGLTKRHISFTKFIQPVTNEARAAQRFIYEAVQGGVEGTPTSD